MWDVKKERGEDLEYSLEKSVPLFSASLGLVYGMLILTAIAWSYKNFCKIEPKMSYHPSGKGHSWRLL